MALNSHGYGFFSVPEPSVIHPISQWPSLGTPFEVREYVWCRGYKINLLYFPLITISVLDRLRITNPETFFVKKSSFHLKLSLLDVMAEGRVHCVWFLCSPEEQRFSLKNFATFLKVIFRGKL